LTAARAAVDAGDRATALTEITAALELDPEFLAAQSLRDCVLAIQSDPPGLPALPAPPDPREPLAPSADLAPSPSASPAGYAKFEQRARRRRVDHRIDAARVAIQQQRLRAAAAALDEVIDLDPNLPELAELTAQFDELRRCVATPRRGPWVAAAAVFAAGLFGASWLQDSTPILSRQIVSAAPLPDPIAPTLAVTAPITVAGTTGTRDTAALPARVVETPRMAEASSSVSPASLRLATVPVDAPPAAHAAETGTAAPEAGTLVPISTPLSSRSDTPGDDVLVKQVLQRYRSAYEGLDAQSAQAVWPAVNQTALARAFDGLESQSLTFDACDVRLRGEAATATCHGSARYVPKVGSRDPKVESRVWNFTLHKAGSDWKIESARAER
jgi:tetratricopeptide (TPR) repeat protein